MGQEQSSVKCDQEQINGIFENNFRVNIEERMKQTIDIPDDPFFLPNRHGRIIRLQKVPMTNGESSNVEGNPADASQANGSNGLPQNKIYSVREVYSDGSTYEGEKLNQFRTGFGVFVFVNKAVYKGGWANDQMSGKGLLYYKSGQLAYQGSFRDNQFDGFGCLMNEIIDYNLAEDDDQYYRDINRLEKRWIKFEGQFEADKKRGKGQLFFSNGDVLKANFNHDQVNGEGELTRAATGAVIKGKWEKNVMTWCSLDQPEE